MTQRGHKLLIYKNAKFVKDREFQETINWRCANFRRYNCRARVVTKLVNGAIMMKFTHAVHTHPNSLY